MRILLSVLLTLATLILAVLSFVALADTNLWWVRITDFPRLQYVIALGVLLVLLAIVGKSSRRLRAALAAVVMVALGYNAVKLGPYFLGERATNEQCPVDQRLSIMVANVQLENRHAEPLLEIIRNRKPDVFLALETNEWWDRRLSALSDTMPYSVAEITGSYFGMHMFSQLPLEDTQTIFPVSQVSMPTEFSSKGPK